MSPVFPPASALAVEPKPVPSAEALTSEAAMDREDIARELWGDRGWQAVARLCHYFESQGMKGLDCPPLPRPG